jgi:hypothetical protein
MVVVPWAGPVVRGPPINMISHATPFIPHVLSSRRISSLIVPWIDSVWKFLPRWGVLSLTLELEKDIFHSEHLIELDQED